jgi:ABC-type glycerol-3-phosphate transport system substrate-binding protein
MKTHAQIKTLLAHYDYLPPGERGEVDAHLVTCAECASELAARPVAATQAESPRLLAPASPDRLPEPPPQPLLLPEPEPANDPPPRAPFPWQRLLLPFGLVLLFVAAIAYGVREPARDPVPPSPTPDSPALAGTPHPESTGAPAGATILFACDDVAAVYNDYARIARAFEAQNPGIEIELKSYRDLLGNQSLSYTEYMQEIAANADAFCVWEVAPLVDADLLYNLDPFLARDSTFAPDDLYPAVLDTARANGSLYAVPSRFQPALIRYDPQAFDGAGLPHPRPGWTWDDFASAAKALTQREDGNTRRWGFAEDAPTIFNARFRAALRDPAFAAAASGDKPLANPAVSDLFGWYQRLYVDDRAAPVPRDLESSFAASGLVFVDPRDVGRGRMAMWSDLMYQNARRQGKPAPFPVDGNVGGAPVFTDPAWAIAAESLHPEAAWRWLNYLSRNPPPDRDQLRLPTRRSLVERLPFWQELPADEAVVYRYVLDHLESRPGPPAGEEKVAALYGVLTGMVSSQMTLPALLARATTASGAANPVPANIPVLTLAVPRDHVSYYRTAAAAYSRATLRANVEVIARESLSDPTRAEDTTIWQQMRQVANRADVIAGPGVAALARSGRADGILLDLAPRLADLPPGRNFYSNTLESLAWRGATWAVPDRIFVYMIAYNGDVFDQMGAARPRAGWTWEDFARAAQAVTQPSADKMKWWGFSDGAGGTLPLLLAATGPLVDYGADPPRPLLDTPRVAEVAGWYARLWRQGYITVPDARETARDMAAPRKAAMWVELVDSAAVERLQLAGIDLAPFPAGPNSDATTPIEIENAFAISAATEQPEAAWQLIDFLLRYRSPDAPPGSPAQPGGAPSAPWESSEALAAYEYALSRAQPAAPLRREEYIARVALVDAVARLAMGESDAQRALRDAQVAASSRMGQ